MIYDHERHSTCDLQHHQAVANETPEQKAHVYICLLTILECSGAYTHILMPTQSQIYRFNVIFMWGPRVCSGH
jgi:hypothetical protein